MDDDIGIEIDMGPLHGMLNTLLAQVASPHQVLDDIGALLENNARARLNDTKTAPGGTPWAPLMPSTRAAYDRADTHVDRHGNTEMRRQGTLLMRSGHMEGSLSHQVDGDGLALGFGMPYAKYHEFGTDKMDARRILTLDPEAGTLAGEDIVSIHELLSMYFQQ